MNDDKHINIYIFLIFISSIPLSIVSTYYDFKYNYSDIQDVSKFINSKLSDENIYFTEKAYVSPITAYSKNKIYDLRHNKYITYVIWTNHADDKLNYKKIEKRLKNSTNYFIRPINYTTYVDNDIDGLIEYLNNSFKIKKIYETNKYIITDEKYIIYKLIKRK